MSARPAPALKIAPLGAAAGRRKNKRGRIGGPSGISFYGGGTEQKRIPGGAGRGSCRSGRRSQAGHVGRRESASRTVSRMADHRPDGGARGSRDAAQRQVVSRQRQERRAV